MALKDWKKTSNMGIKDYIVYKSQRYVGLTLEISKNTNTDKYIVYTNNRHNISKLKEGIKTKSQALKFAKEYMRKH